MAGIGIRDSKKFKIGSVHENGGGKFEIIDRYIEDNVVMLKVKYLASGEEETNKEVNVNASIWKFQKVRGMTPSSVKKTSIEELIVTSVDELRDTTAQISAEHEEITSKLDFLTELMEKVLIEQERYTSTLRERMKTNELLEARIAESQKVALSAQELLSKAFDKIK